MDRGTVERSATPQPHRIDAPLVRQRARGYSHAPTPEENLRKYFGEVVGVPLESIPYSTDLPEGFDPESLINAKPYKGTSAGEPSVPIYQLPIVVSNAGYNAGEFEKMVFFRRGLGHTIAADVFYRRANGEAWKADGGNHDFSPSEFGVALTSVPVELQWPKS